MSPLRQIVEVPPIEAIRRTTARIFAFAVGEGRMIAVGRLCITGDHGHCLACGARQGEPCRQPRT